jgi:4-hydroxybenzoyl-CoA thioesterase
LTSTAIRTSPTPRRESPRAFRLAIPVLFADVDPAGSAYYPRLVDYCHRSFEMFFDARSKTPYSRLIASGIGLPAAHFDVDFESPLRHGDIATIEVRVERIGRTSLTLAYTARRGRVVAFRARNVVVCVNLKTGRPQPIPAPLRRALAPRKALRPRTTSG